MLEDWNKGVICVRQSVQEVENVKNDDGIKADNNQDCKWRIECFVIVCLSGML